MFGIGMPEMLLILAVALIVFGPKRLPELAKSLGRALGEFKRATTDLKQSIETETGLDEVRHTIDDVKKDIKSDADRPQKPAASTSESPVPDQPDEPLSRVKAAFDEMNAGPDGVQAEEEQADLDPEVKPQGSTAP